MSKAKKQDRDSRTGSGPLRVKLSDFAPPDFWRQLRVDIPARREPEHAGAA